MSLQISRSIGDAYLKNAEFNREPLLPKFRLPEPFERPILRAEPTVLVQKLYPEDQFLIFASDGLWEQLTNQEAVDIVNRCPRNVGFLFKILSYTCICVGHCHYLYPFLLSRIRCANILSIGAFFFYLFLLSYYVIRIYSLFLVLVSSFGKEFVKFQTLILVLESRLCVVPLEFLC